MEEEKRGCSVVVAAMILEILLLPSGYHDPLILAPCGFTNLRLTSAARFLHALAQRRRKRLSQGALSATWHARIPTLSPPGTQRGADASDMLSRNAPRRHGDEEQVTPGGELSVRSRSASSNAAQRQRRRQD